ncbi:MULTISPECIES: sugar MFS transporter [unclassified Plantactinospora]|uniref:MFS transporter n=1 Tax=unclassified Plantactinospora TaxID=2631981 RepID=UPI000D16A631|nr:MULTISPECIES: MFS transporter [unclassified Plantactinospora]AVT32001.1 MFS transporter [Plantactinospora sp. BC1]AVT40432.1 MFS transporter [Plantactinospora sp. BB1]
MSTPSRRGPGLAVLVLAYLAFVSLGLPDGLLGVGWPSISAELEAPTEAVGLLLTSATVGYLVSSVVAGFSIARLGVGWLLAGSTVLASLALAGYAAAPALSIVIGCALLLGLGSGAIDAGLNAYAADAFGPRQMNWLHAFFGLGVAIGPLVMTTVLGAGLGWRWGYGILAAAQAGLALAFVLTVRTWERRRGADAAEGPDPAPAAPAGPVRIGATLALPAVWFGVLTFAVYVAIEVGAGLWAFLLLTEDRGISPTVAGLCVSLYWGSLFLGRVVQGFVAERLGTRRVLLGSMYAMAFGSALVAIPGPGWLAVAGLAVIGFGAAAVFPLLTLSTAERVGRQHADRTIGLQIGASGLGGAIIPGAIGVLIGRTSVAVLGPALVVLSLAMIALYWASSRRAARHPVPAG